MASTDYAVNLLIMRHRDFAPEDDSKEAIGRRLQAVREIVGLNKTQFARNAGLKIQTYGPWENGRREITLDGAKAIRSRYGVPLEFTYFGNIDALPHKIARYLDGKPSDSSSQKSRGKPD